MKGVVFNLLERVVADAHGEDTWDDLVDAAGVSGAYTSLGSYPDEELMALVGAASAALGLPADEVVRWFGQQTIPLFAAGHAELFAAHRGHRSFLLGLNDVIHPEVRKLYPGAATPTFVFDTSASDRLLMEYHSERALCAFAHGLLEGTVVHYGETATVSHRACTRSGDPHCVLEISMM